ncbi:chorion class B protein PC10-like [Aricia agestis]|uniref:chorion class B protein PC10-like n=1 Tax=Aricia agestis TaxID=91739 RepID=UPI001C20806F|nr:chorion class B protein PC10-like [Aricia agestis]
MDFRAVWFVALYLQSISAQCIRSPTIETYEGPLLSYPAASIPLSGVISGLPDSLASSPNPLSPWASSMVSPLAPIAMPCLNGFGPAALAASTGTALFTTSYSPIAPVGIFIHSENYFDGTVSVAGQVPFLGSIALEGALPSAGTGSILYGCGDGDIFIMSEEVADPYYKRGSIYDFGPYGYERPPYGYGYGIRY